jgi:hypothetical protein
MKTILVVLFLVSIQGKAQTISNVFNEDSIQIVKNRKYEGVIFPAEYVINGFFGDFAYRYTPEYRDIEQVEEFLRPPHKYPMKYKRQYIGFISHSGSKIIFVQFLNLSKPKMRKLANNWKKSYVLILGDYFYKNSRVIMFNLNENKIIESIE